MLRRLTPRPWMVLAALAVVGLGVVALHPRRALHWARHYGHRIHLPVHRSRWIDFVDDTPPPIATTEQIGNGLIVFRRSLLERVYPHSKPRADEIVFSASLQATPGEYEAVQLAVYPLRDLHEMQVSVTDLTDSERHVILASEIAVRMVRYYGVPLSIRVGNRFGVVPKTLEVAVPLELQQEAVRPYWITVHVPENQPGGAYEGDILFEHTTGRQRIHLSVDVTPVKLQEPDILYGTLCTNVLANVWKLRRAPKLLHQADVIFRDQREHGMNTMSLRSVEVYEEAQGQPYLPDLEAAIALSKKYQFTKPLMYCPGLLFKTNKITRSNNYKQYDADIEIPEAKKVAQHYTQAFHDAGLPGPVFIPVEEPNLRSGIDRADPADIRYQMAGELTKAIKESGASTGMTCTPESVQSAIDYLDYWIVAYKRFTPKLYEMARQAHARLCLYANGTMMGQGTYFTRFLFGYFAWASGIKGLLPWTYPMQPKRFPKNIGHRGEGGLHIEDGFLGLDGKPVPTIQWELAREGIDDAKYLVTIDALAKQAREAGTPAQFAAAEEADRFLTEIRTSINPDVRHYVFEDDKTFEPVPVDNWNAERFDIVRRRSVAILKQLLDATASDRIAAP